MRRLLAAAALVAGVVMTMASPAAANGDYCQPPTAEAKYKPPTCDTTTTTTEVDDTTTTTEVDDTTTTTAVEDTTTTTAVEDTTTTTGVTTTTGAPTTTTIPEPPVTTVPGEPTPVFVCADFRGNLVLAEQWRLYYVSIGRSDLAANLTNCAPTETTTKVTLPATGSNAENTAIAASIAAGLGAIALLAARRRRRTS